MNKIQIINANKKYNLNIEFINAFPIGYYKIDYEDVELLKIIPSPVFIECKNDNSLSISHISNIEQLTFLTSILTAIFTNEIMNSKI